jgi:hypothetical protein
LTAFFEKFSAYSSRRDYSPTFWPPVPVAFHKLPGPFTPCLPCRSDTHHRHWPSSFCLSTEIYSHVYIVCVVSMYPERPAILPSTLNRIESLPFSVCRWSVIIVNIFHLYYYNNLMLNIIFFIYISGAAYCFSLCFILNAL